ncbi:MAG: helix-hairpin-helix domain-containing protein [Burkholderiaceae bacterium]|nr:helix-hairpin-helix domain-containing protein [Burkholderiaceae bacterium]
MFNKLLMFFAVLIATMGLAFAQVDVNRATQAELDGIKGIGPKISRTILAERNKGGNFKDWDDLQKRVKGIGEKNSVKLSQAGLTVGGKSKPGVSARVDNKAGKNDANAARKTGQSGLGVADRAAGK